MCARWRRALFSATLMELLICWVAFPLLLTLVAQGCGALVALAAGRPLVATVRLPCGTALAMAVLDLVTRSSATALLAVPAVAVLTVVGLIVSRPRPHRPSSALAAALIAFAALAAPIVLSGQATWAGYIKLDDTSSWLGLVDRALTHGHSLAGVPPSTYRLVLEAYLAVGYPIGSFLPLGLGHVLLGQETAWLVDPWMAFMAAMIALALHRVATLALAASPGWQRAVIAGVGAQPALLYGYYLWGGIKEMAGAMLVAAFAVTAPLALTAVGGRARARALIPAFVVVWAMVASLSPGGLVWVGPGLLISAVLAAAVSWRDLPRPRWRTHDETAGDRSGGPAGGGGSAGGGGPRVGAPLPAGAGGAPGSGTTAGALPLVRQPVVLWAAALTLLTAIGAYLVFRPGGFVEKFHNVLTSGGQLGNLLTPLSIQQLAGIWPTGDFRYAPNELAITHVLEIVVTLGAVAALVIAVARKRYELMLLLLCAVTGAVLIDLIASPWLGGKGLATGSIAIPFGALVTAGWLLQRDRSTVARTGGAVLGAIVVGGVAWSNLLAYHAVSLAPRQLMAEVATIGGRIAGQGPTLMDEFSSYATHHFLRDAAPESASDIRTRPDYLITGHSLPFGDSADIDDFVLDSVLAYRTLVLQRGPSASRPPSPYKLVYQDRDWQVWQRPQQINPRVLYHEAFDTTFQPGLVPVCSAVLKFAKLKGIRELVAAPARNGIFVTASTGTHPAKWSSSSGRFLTLDGAGTAKIPVTVTAPGRYTVWLNGSARAPITLSVDGRKVGEVRDQLQEPGQYMQFGNVDLEPGRHTVQLQYGGGDWRPGSGGLPEKVGPLALTLDAPQPALLHVAPSDAHSLCGRNLDWLEGLAAPRA